MTDSLLLSTSACWIVALSLLAAPATAQRCPEEPILRHETPTGEVPQTGFLTGDEWGVIFDTEVPADHYPIEITRVAFELGVSSGGADLVPHDSLRIYGGGLPDPGLPQFVLPGVSLFSNSGAIIDLRTLPNVSGQDRVITQGPFSVTYKLAVDAEGPLGAPPVHDIDGCQPGKNIRFTAAGPNSGWSDACASGATGDWSVAIFYERLDCLGDGPGVVFCAAGGNPIFCSDCLCGNNPPLGSPGGCLNSEARSAELSASGEASLSNDTLRFGATGATSGNFGILVSAANRLPNGGPFCLDGGGIGDGFTDGLRCVGGEAIRHGTRTSNALGEFGVSTPGWGFPDPPAGGLIASSGFAAGQIRHFQLFYRDDPSAGCLRGQNTSNAISIQFAP